MLHSEQISPGLVKEQNVVRTPIDADGQFRSQHDINRGSEALGPGFDRSEGRLRPVESADWFIRLAPCHQASLKV